MASGKSYAKTGITVRERFLNKYYTKNCKNNKINEMIPSRNKKPRIKDIITWSTREAGMMTEQYQQKNHSNNNNTSTALKTRAFNLTPIVFKVKN